MTETIKRKRISYIEFTFRGGKINSDDGDNKEKKSYIEFTFDQPTEQ